MADTPYFSASTFCTLYMSVEVSSRMERIRRPEMRSPFGGVYTGTDPRSAARIDLGAWKSEVVAIASFMKWFEYSSNDVGDASAAMAHFLSSISFVMFAPAALICICF